MAAERERLIAHRTRLLARCQQARESRRRSDMLAAREAVEQAMQARDAADQDVVLAAQARIDTLRTTYDNMASGSFDGSAIQSLRQTEENLLRDQNRKEAQLAQAEAAIMEADRMAQEATLAYQAEAQRTRKREKMADRAKVMYRQLQSTEEESAAEEELGDRLAVTAGR